MPNRMWLALLFVILATGALAQAPAFEAVSCPKGIRATRCGYVQVPENRANPVRTIRLSVYVVENHSPGKAPDPVFFLAGGLGEHAAMYTVLAGLFDRDFVTFDQRGVGRSQPALDCTEEYAGSSPSFPDGEEAEEALRALEACGRRLRAAGVDLSAYNATESAADVEDVRRALGYGKINLVGLSYGTRLALEVMRHFPGALRAAVLDGVIPPQVDRPVETVRAVEEAFLGVLAACRADARCRAAYPYLEQAHAEVYDRLNRRPLTVPYGSSTVQIDAGRFQSLVLGSLYSPLTIAELPSLIYALREGETAALTRSTVWRFLQIFSGVITVGAFFAHECRGEMAYSSLEGLRAAYAEFPRWRGSLGTEPGISSERGFAVCRAWGLTQPSGEENSPVKSDVPTLLLAGQFDPVTPRAGSRWLPRDCPTPTPSSCRASRTGQDWAASAGSLSSGLSWPTRLPGPMPPVRSNSGRGSRCLRAIRAMAQALHGPRAARDSIPLPISLYPTPIAPTPPPRITLERVMNSGISLGDESKAVS